MVGTAQVNSGSDGHDGAFNPTQNITIDMADHPDGIYHYTSVNIPNGVTVSFIPNAKNTPVVWLVQGDCVIAGIVDVSGKSASGGAGGIGGPGGWAGGNGGNENNLASYGLGPGGGAPGINDSLGIYFGGNGSFGTKGNVIGQQKSAGNIYGNIFLLPLTGGSGGGGSAGFVSGGAGGGGAMLIASSSAITLNGVIAASGGGGTAWLAIGDGSGGGVRLVTPSLSGNGQVVATGGVTNPSNGNSSSNGGYGRVRFDALQNSFGGNVAGLLTKGFQPIILPVPNQGIQLNIDSIGGVAVGGSPGGVLVNPDVTIPAQQSNPLNVLVNCTNVPLNTDIIVKVHPANGPDVTATAKNTAGTLAASTATIPVAMPHGGGIIYASAVTGIAGGTGATDAKEERLKNLAQTGWTADGERFVAMEITAGMGGKQSVSYLTDSGKRYAMPQ